MDVDNGSARNGMSTRPLAVMMFANATERAGAEEHILELLRRLDRRLFRLHLACPDVLLGKYGDDIPKDVYVTPIMLDHLSDLRGAIRLARISAGRGGREGDRGAKEEPGALGTTGEPGAEGAEGA